MRQGLRIACVVAVFAAATAAAIEYQINFTDGTELRTSRVRQVGDSIQYEKFGGEASVAVDEVASVYIIEPDGEISWVMQPRRDGAPPAVTQRSEGPPPQGAPPAVQPEPRPASEPKAPPTDPAAPPVSADAARTPDSGRSATDMPQDGTATPAPPATPAPAQAHSDSPAGGGSEAAPRSGKVILDPAEPLPMVLLRWGGAPVAALLALLGAALVFRKKFRAGEQGIPATGPLASVGEHEVDFSEPSRAWETLVSAIEERDFDVYRLCWQQRYSDEDLDLTFQKSLTNWKYYDYSVTETEPHPKSKERFYLHVKRSTKFDREDLEERVRRLSLVLTDGGWKFEEVPYNF